MPTVSGWLGELDTNHAYFPATSLLYSGTSKQLGWLGQLDTFNAFFPNALTYSGTLKVSGWLGQLDTFRAWFPASALQYTLETGSTPFVPPPPIPGTPVQILAGGYTGMFWMKNVLVLTKEWWDSGLAAPYQGQLWPVPISSVGGGQVYPY